MRSIGFLRFVLPVTGVVPVFSQQSLEVFHFWLMFSGMGWTCGRPKLLTRLAANPSLDVSMILAGVETEQKSDSAEGGLICEYVYTLLMRYATSVERIETLARSLEEGCVPLRWWL